MTSNILDKGMLRHFRARQAAAVLASAVIYLTNQAFGAPSAAPPPAAGNPVDALRAIAAHSKCASHPWPEHRGVAPKGYIEGVTLVFARALCHPERADVQIVSAPPASAPPASAPPASAPPASAPPASAKADDALAVYKSDFARLGMRIDRTGPETLRHSYALLLGLGMMESSGIYCEGRDVSECFASADSAEAGLFQTSYGARVHSPALTWLFQQFSADQTNCLLPVFAGPVCHIAKSHNAKCPNATSGIAGTGPGADWQKLTKSCPAFAVEYGAVVLRTHGGSKGEFNPIRKHQAELSVDCDAMLQDAQAYVSQHSDACPLL